VPQAARRLVAQHRLGTHLASYRGRWWPYLLGAVFFLSLAFVLVLNGVEMVSVYGFSAVLCIGLFLSVAFARFRYRAYIFDEGFVEFTWRRAFAFRWSDVAVLQLEEEQSKSGGLHWPRLAVSFASGGKWRLPGYGFHPPDLKARLDYEITSHLVQPAITNYEAGESLWFGQWSLSRGAINTGTQTLRIDQLVDFMPGETDTLVALIQEEPTQVDVPPQLPNSHVLLGVVQHALVSERKQRLKAAIEQLDAGQTVEMGRWRLNSDGLQYGDDESVPWRYVLEVDPGGVVVQGSQTRKLWRDRSLPMVLKEVL